MHPLILDDAALKIATAKLADVPILTGPDGKFLAPGIIVMVEGNAEVGEPPWRPANPLTQLLVAGTEACRDIELHAPGVLETRTRRRTLKVLTVSVCSLMDVVQKALTVLNTRAASCYRQLWPAPDQATYDQAWKRLRKQHMRGPVRRVRDQLGAHVDSSVFSSGGPSVDADAVLGAMGDSLVLMLLILNHPRSFSWFRRLESIDEEHHVIEVMQFYPLCISWVVDSSGRVTDVLPEVRLAEDPLRLVQRELHSAIGTRNRMVFGGKQTFRPRSHVQRGRGGPSPRAKVALERLLHPPLPSRPQHACAHAQRRKRWL